jgi:hypothetical protein
MRYVSVPEAENGSFSCALGPHLGREIGTADPKNHRVIGGGVPSKGQLID